jgi:hypothetical protein
MGLSDDADLLLLSIDLGNYAILTEIAAELVHLNLHPHVFSEPLLLQLLLFQADLVR